MHCALFSNTRAKIRIIKRILAWALHKDDMQIHEVFHIFKGSIHQEDITMVSMYAPNIETE